MSKAMKAALDAVKNMKPDIQSRLLDAKRYLEHLQETKFAEEIEVHAEAALESVLEALQGFSLSPPVRFFVYDAEGDEVDIKEVSEADFLEAKGAIEYERQTVFENGCSQICLTKNPYHDC